MSEEHAQVASRGFRCPSCSAPDMRFDAEQQLMLCDHCGHLLQPPKSEGSAAIVEYDLEQGLAQAARGLGTAEPRRTAACEECGAKVSFAGKATTGCCDFCGSQRLLEQAADTTLIRPESLVPFKIAQNKASALFREWIKGLWFRPSDLKHKAKMTEIQGVYVPYWTFDAHVESEWTAEAGYHYYETEYYEDEEGKERERKVLRTRWEPAWGGREDDFDDVLACASKGLPVALADRLTTFDTRALQPYQPEFLSGWKAEEYALELNEAWKHAVGKMERQQDSRCAGDVPGDTQRFLNVTNRFSEETFKHVLLPIWISAYRYKDQVYRFLVNGQSGEVQGKAPWSWPKILGFAAALAGTIAVIALLVHHFR